MATLTHPQHLDKRLVHGKAGFFGAGFEGVGGCVGWEFGDVVAGFADEHLADMGAVGERRLGAAQHFHDVAGRQGLVAAPQ